MTRCAMSKTASLMGGWVSINNLLTIPETAVNNSLLGSGSAAHGAARTLYIRFQKGDQHARTKATNGPSQLGTRRVERVEAVGSASP